MKMNNYKVTRKRAYWVEETMYVESEGVEEAESTFFNEFTVELEVGEVFDFNGEQFEHSLEVTEIEQPEEIVVNGIKTTDCIALHHDD